MDTSCQRFTNIMLFNIAINTYFEDKHSWTRNNTPIFKHAIDTDDTIEVCNQCYLEGKCMPARNASKKYECGRDELADCQISEWM